MCILCYGFSPHGQIANGQIATDKTLHGQIATNKTPNGREKGCYRFGCILYITACEEFSIMYFLI